MQKLSVDDILGELKGKSADGRQLPSMTQIDNLIDDILKKKQYDEIEKDKRTLSLKEKKELDEERAAQTKTLTAQYEEIRQKLQTDPFIKKEEPPKKKGSYIKLSATGEMQLISLQKNQQVKYIDTSTIELTDEIKINRQKKLENLERKANNTYIKQDIREITSHFEKTAEQGPISPLADPKRYREFKGERQKKVNSFVLNPEKPPVALSQDEPTPIYEERKQTTAPLEFGESSVTITKADEEAEEFEYTDSSQAESVYASLQASRKNNLICTIILAVLSAVSALFLFSSAEDGKINIANIFSMAPTTFVYFNLGLIVASVASSYNVIVNAWHSLSLHKPDKDILFSALMVLSLGVISVFCLYPESLLTNGVTLLTPVFTILLLANHLSKSIDIKKIISSFEFVSEDGEKSSVGFVSPEKTAQSFCAGLKEIEEPIVAKNTKTRFLSDFIKTSFDYDYADELSGKMLNIGLVAATIIFLAALLLTRNAFLGISMAFATLLICTGFLTSLVFSLPVLNTMGLLNHFSGMMPGYNAIELYQDVNAAMVEAGELFSSENVVLNGIKTFQGKRVDEAIVDAASILSHTDSVLKNVFMEIISNNEKLLREVDSVVYEDGMGISGWVDQKRVLIGNRELMVNHSIAMPKLEYENKYTQAGQELIYISTGGELCAAFVITLQATHESRDTIMMFYKNNISILFRTMDFFITAPLIERLYDIEKGFVKIIPGRLHREFADQTVETETASSILANRGNPFGYAVELAVCKAMYPCVKLGGTLHMASAGCGVLLVLVALFLNVPNLVSGIAILGFSAFFALAYWLYERNVKL